MPNSLEKTVMGLAKAALNAQQSSAPAPSPPKAKKPRVSTGRAMLLGAGLMVAGQALVKSRGREALNAVRHGLADRIDGTGADEMEPMDEDEAFDEPLEDEDAAYSDEAEADEDELVDEEDVDEEEPAPRAPRRRAATRGRGRS